MSFQASGNPALSEIASGIIAGCLPTLPRLFKHYSSKTSPSSSKSLRTSWRRLFRKPATTDPISNGKPPSSLFWRNLLSDTSKGSKLKADSTAPRITTLDFSRDSFQFADGDLQKSPEPACTNQTLATARINAFEGIGDGFHPWRGADDVEAAVPATDWAASYKLWR